MSLRSYSRMVWWTPLLMSALLIPIPPASGEYQAEEKKGVLRLRVRVKIGETTKGLSRKRFFLLKGSLEQNAATISAINSQPIVSRDCYYTRLKASPSLINWLRESDCESVYCREVEDSDLTGATAVPEFVAAVAAGEKEFGSKDVARKWITDNLPEKLRDGFFKEQQTAIQSLRRQAEQSSGTPVISAMTDRNGTAYFTDLAPGTYVLSNLLPAEVGGTHVTWNCEVQIKPGDLATEKPYQISNKQDRNIKCVGVEKPLPACELSAGDRN